MSTNIKILILLILLSLVFLCFEISTADYLGDYTENKTINFIWSTNDSNGASCIRTTKGSVVVYKNGDSNEITGGITDTNNFDSTTGLQLCTIDLSADANYTSGADYTLVLKGAVIDGQTVNCNIGKFSIQNRYMRKGSRYD